MSSFINPDVDRVSLSERVRKLEARFPGGGGGGGLGVGMPDFDQYPDNAFSETPEGLILKISIDNLGNHNVADLNGIGLKYIYFWKWIASWAVYLPVSLGRVHITRQFRPITQDRNDIRTNISIDNHDLLVNTFFSGWPTTNHFQMITSEIRLYGPKSPTLGGVNSGSLSLCVLRIAINYGENLSFYISKSTQSGTVYPSYIFGAGCSSAIIKNFPNTNIPIDVGSAHGSITNGSMMTAIQLTDLPASALNLYPKSWCQ